MRIGVFLHIFNNKSLQEALDQVQEVGLDTVEIPTGNYPGDALCQTDHLLKDKSLLKNFKSEFDKRGISISTLSCHGNPVHPDEDLARKHREITRKTFILANILEVDRVTLLSGCPGDSEQSKYPNWVTCAWPEDYPKILKWQWEEKVIPYWREEVEFAKKEGINKICIEMHPGFVVYNPETLLKLRKTVGEIIGVNFDPSHLFWMGIDPIAALKKLSDCIYHVHAKDTKIDHNNKSINGVIDTKSFRDGQNRSWIFRTVGYGHDILFWKDFISSLRMIGYDHAISIEHEDILIGRIEGLKKSVSFLKQIIFEEKADKIWR